MLALAVALVFNDALSMKARPYRGVYYLHDTQSFASIWSTLSKTGSVVYNNLNSHRRFQDALAEHLPSNQKEISLWTFCGLAPFLFHVARVLVYYAAKLDETRRQKSAQTAKSLSSLIYARAVDGLRSALSMPTRTVEGVLGDVDACADLQTTTIFPVASWIPHHTGCNARLWQNMDLSDPEADSSDEDSRPAKRMRSQTSL